MALTLNELIRQNKQRPIRRCYIKRRDTAGNYEGSWVRIDNDTKYGANRVIDWGAGSKQIDIQPGAVAIYDISELNLKFDNSDGYFNIETDTQSKWYPETTYLNRKFTKLKIECGYLDVDGETEIGVADVFEGYIDRVVISQDQIASVSVLSYQAILTKYLVTDLSLSGSKNVSDIVDAIMNQPKITTYIPFVASTPDNDYQLSSSQVQALDGTYWDVLQELAYLSNSVIKLNNDTFDFNSRDVGVSSVFDFKGQGSDEDKDIYSVLSYDDEGADRVRTLWKEQGGSLTAETADATLALKYFNDPEIVDLSGVTSSDRQGVLNALLAQWESNIPVIKFSTRFLVSQVDLLDKITIEILGQLVPAEGGFYWDSWLWDDGSVWGELNSSINIFSSYEWMVTQVENDFDNWKTVVRAERVV